MGRRAVAAAAVLMAILAAAGVVEAQRYFREGSFAARWAPAQMPDSSFVICRVAYRSVRMEYSGIGWQTDYPYAEINLTTRLSELTKTRVSRDDSKQPNFYVVRLTDDQLFKCPMLIGSDVGTAALSETEVQRLREYLLKGGFLWVDDFWGTPAWEQWSDVIARVLPEFPIVDTTPADPIRQALFTITEVKQVPSIFTWAGPGSDPRERGTDSPHANFRVIADTHGRVIVAMTHNTDIGDSMEREGDDPDYFAAFSPDGYALVTNIVLYALTH